MTTRPESIKSTRSALSGRDHRTDEYVYGSESRDLHMRHDLGVVSLGA